MKYAASFAPNHSLNIRGSITFRHESIVRGSHRDMKKNSTIISSTDSNARANFNLQEWDVAMSHSNYLGLQLEVSSGLKL